MKHTLMKRMWIALLAAILCLAALPLAGCQQESGGEQENETETETGDQRPAIEPVNDNYRTFYQVFVGSFSDSNNDGIGDIRGVINRMDYLNNGKSDGTSLDVQGIWLSPVFSSPSYHKYDVTDYYKIDWRFGMESDLKELIDLCHERNVKLILDVAINHTSNQHAWFTQFKDARINGDTQSPYYDYYSCATAADKRPGATYQKIAGIDCYYECNFSTDMPELNLENPQVRTAVLDVAKYYLNLGVDGFRFDAIKYVDYGNTAKSVEFWDWYMKELRAIKSDIYCVGECWSAESEILEYYGTMNCFNFAMSQAEGVAASAAKGFSISSYTNYITSFQDKVQGKNPDSMMISFLSNHDMDRIAGAFILESNLRMAANLYLLTPGSPVIYYGEELGMRGSRGGANTDANRRLAMLWGDDDLIRDPLGATYSADKQIQTTVADQMADENSMLRYYCKLINIRHTYPAIARGDYTAVSGGSSTFGGFLIEQDGEFLVMLHNTGTEEVTLDLSTCRDLACKVPTQLCDFIGKGNARLEGNTLTVGAQTTVILK